MIRSRLVVAVFLGLGMAHSALAGDWEVPEGQWYFSPMIGASFEDKERHADPGVAGSLGLGRQLTESWAMELSLFGGNNPGFNTFRPVGAGIDFLLDLSDSGLFSPYLILGTGFMRADIIEHHIVDRELNYDSAIGTVGFGLLAPLGNASTRIRGEVRYRADFKSPQFKDVLVLVGFYMPLGDTASRPAKITQLPDSDGDGIADDIDLCPATPKGVEIDVFGCELDTDEDGVSNVKDDCPATPRGAQVDRRGCTVAADNDGDGVSDANDRCPGTPRSVRVDATGCEVDDDSDGVVNSLDSCPNTPSGARIDIRGCEIGGTIRLPGVRFGLNSADLISTSTAKLDQAAATLRSNPGLKVEAAGYTDTSGAADHNMNLSQRRAEAVRLYLISKGANEDNITARGYGEASPIADNSTRTGRQQNRRVDLRVLN